jgi:hypothetical protein
LLAPAAGAQVASGSDAKQPPPGLASLAMPRVGRALQVSSYDRTGGNVDSGNYLRVEPDGTRVLVDQAGPGRITRIWSANPGTRLQIKLDDVVVFDDEWSRLFDGSLPPFAPPLADRSSGGHTSYVSLPFQRHCLIKAPPGHGFFYHVGLELRPEVETFQFPPGPRLQEELQLLAGGGRSRDAGPILRFLGRRLFDRLVVADLSGPGEVVELRLLPRTAGSPVDFWRQEGRAVWLEARVDGQPKPTVAVPIGDLFGVDPDGQGVETQVTKSLGRARVFALPIPFASRLELVLVRRLATTSPPPGFDFETAWHPLDDKGGRLTLHGTIARGKNRGGAPFRALSVNGSGHFVGGFFTLAGAAGQGFSFLEGDETITADGQVSHRGTGTEDYFGGGWYFQSGPFGRPFHSAATVDERRTIVAAARWHVPDPISFAQSLQFDLEHGGRNDSPDSDYAAALFWYAESAVGRDVDLELTRRIADPQRPSHPQHFEAEDLWPWHFYRDALTQQNASGGAVARLPGGAHAAWPLLDSGDLLISARSGAQILLVPTILEASMPREIRLDVVQASLAVDEVRVEPYLPAIRAWRLVGPFAAANRRGIDTVYGPELDWSPTRTYQVLGNGPRGWQDVPIPLAATGRMDLDPIFLNRDEVVAYAYTHVESPHDQDGVLLLGSDDAIKVFWNGAEVHRHAVQRAAVRDQDRVQIRIRAGSNSLLLKVEDYEAAFGFYARIDGADGLRFSPRGG